MYRIYIAHAIQFYADLRGSTKLYQQSKVPKKDKIFKRKKHS